MLVLMQQRDQSNMKGEIVSDSGNEVGLEVPEKYWEAQTRFGSVKRYC